MFPGGNLQLLARVLIQGLNPASQPFKEHSPHHPFECSHHALHKASLRSHTEPVCPQSGRYKTVARYPSPPCQPNLSEAVDCRPAQAFVCIALTVEVAGESLNDLGGAALGGHLHETVETGLVDLLL